MQNKHFSYYALKPRQGMLYIERFFTSMLVMGFQPFVK